MQAAILETQPVWIMSKELSVTMEINRRLETRPADWPPAFPTARVDVWRVRLDQPPTAGSEGSVLSPDEIARAGRFHFEKDRIHFTRCRTALRGVLSGYLAVPAANIRFEYLISGKPQARGRAESTRAAVQRIPLGEHGVDRCWQ